jgi:hypothetical protein
MLANGTPGRLDESMPRSELTAAELASFFAALVSAAVAVGLLVLGDGSGRQRFVAAVLGVVAVLEISWRWLEWPLARAAALYLAAFLLVVWTVLGLFSIGIILLPAALAALFVAVRGSRGLETETVWALAGLAASAAVAVAALGLIST